MTKNHTESVEEAALLARAITDLHTVGFPQALAKWLSQCLEYDNLTTLAYFSNTAPKLLMSESDQPLVHKNIYKDYIAGAYLFDPFHDLHLTKAPTGVYQLSDIAPDNFLRSRYYLEYYSKTTMSDEIGFILYPTAEVSLHICLGKDHNSATPFTALELSVAHRISPIAASMASAHWSKLTAQKGHSGEASFFNLVDAAEQKLGITLSPRQAEVAMLILKGHSSTSIGIRLGISPQTVKVFRKQLYKKCRISSQAELFRLMLPMIDYNTNDGTPAR